MATPASQTTIRNRLEPAMAMARDPKRAGLLKVNVSTVVLHNDKVLMIREGRGRKRGLWNFPGGKAHLGEKLLTTAVRETLEETGIAVKPVGLLALYVDVRGTTKPSLRLHLSARMLGGRVRIDGEEVLDARWFTVAQLRDLNPKKLWNPHLILQTLVQLDHWSGHPLKLLREVDSFLRVA